MGTTRNSLQYHVYFRCCASTMLHNARCFVFWIPLTPIRPPDSWNLLMETCIIAVTSRGGHTQKWTHPKRPQTENGHKLEPPQTKTATDQEGYKPKQPRTTEATKRPQTERSTNRNGYILEWPHHITPKYFARFIDRNYENYVWENR